MHMLVAYRTVQCSDVQLDERSGVLCSIQWQTFPLEICNHLRHHFLIKWLSSLYQGDIQSQVDFVKFWNKIHENMSILQKPRKKLNEIRFTSLSNFKVENWNDERKCWDALPFLDTSQIKFQAFLTSGLPPWSATTFSYAIFLNASSLSNLFLDSCKKRWTRKRDACETVQHNK